MHIMRAASETHEFAIYCSSVSDLPHLKKNKEVLVTTTTYWEGMRLIDGWGSKGKGTNGTGWEVLTCFHHVCLFLSLTEPETERCWLWNWRSLAQRQSCVSTVCEFCVKFNPVSGYPHLFFCCPCKRRYGKWISMDEKRLFRNCRVSIWYFFCTFFLFSAIK